MVIVVLLHIIIWRRVREKVRERAYGCLEHRQLGLLVARENVYSMINVAYPLHNNAASVGIVELLKVNDIHDYVIKSKPTECFGGSGGHIMNQVGLIQVSILNLELSLRIFGRLSSLMRSL